MAGKATAPTDAQRATPEDEEEGFSLKKLGEAIAKFVLAPIAELGTLARLLSQVLFWVVRPPYRFRLFVEQAEFIGVGSVFIVGLTGFFVGAGALAGFALGCGSGGPPGDTTAIG